MKPQILLVMGILGILFVSGCTQEGTQNAPSTNNGVNTNNQNPIRNIVCGDGFCDRGEDSSNCCLDCNCPSGYSCDRNSCKKLAQCGNRIPEEGETSNNCCVDVGCPTGQTCQNNMCIELKPNIKMASFTGPESGVTYLRAAGSEFNICLTNDGNDYAKNIQITFSNTNNYFATSSITINTIEQNGVKCINSNNIDFLDSVLDIVSETSLHTDIKIEYYNSANKKYETTESATFKVKGRNYFSWSQPEMVSSWVTPSQPTVREFASKATGGLATYGTTTQQVMAARWIFESMRAYGVRYVTDAHVSGDYVLFPIETLKNKGGDCEDNAILFASLIESIGIKSVVILVPGHAFSGFINKENQLVAIETTAQDFDTALTFGYNGYTQATDKTVIYPSDNWDKYPQVILPETSTLDMPSITKQIGTCSVGWTWDKGFVATIPVKFTNSGNAPGAGCAAATTYDSGRNKLGEDIGCWVINPGEIKDVVYMPDISISNWLSGFSCYAI